MNKIKICMDSGKFISFDMESSEKLKDFIKRIMKLDIYIIDCANLNTAIYTKKIEFITEEKI